MPSSSGSGSSPSDILPPPLPRISLSDPTHYDRFSLETPRRLNYGAVAGSTIGFALGAIHSAQMTSLRFRAENAHRLPESTKGWYMYHKTKHYSMMYYGLGGGLKMAGKLAFYTGGFLLMEASVDRLRGERRDFFSTVLAGMSVAGAFSALNRLPLITAARMASLGLKYGLLLGLTQDALSLVRGRRLRYVDFMIRRKPEKGARAVED